MLLCADSCTEDHQVSVITYEIMVHLKNKKEKQYPKKLIFSRSYGFISFQSIEAPFSEQKLEPSLSWNRRESYDHEADLIVS